MGAVEPCVSPPEVLPRELVFVDLETTGGNAARDRITEIGIVRMRDDQVVEEWSSLINPECRIPAYIESFTGITNEMAAAAPTFAAVAATVLDKLRAAVFVAHNARFDYAFLRSEFRRLDVSFTAQVLCTVKLSRRLFPQHVRHNLDVVMERHQLTCRARHRALGDAQVLGDFWTVLRGEIPPQTLCAATRQVIGANRLPDYLPPGLADELPEGPGVYRFFGEQGELLYIGRSHALRSRILGHFAADSEDPKQQKKAARTRRIDWLETAGELGAQLTEAQWLKTQQPLFNKRLKPGGSFTWQPLRAGSGLCLALLDEVAPAGLGECFGVFHTEQDARKALAEVARAHSLCLKVLDRAPGEGSCLAYQLGRCRGACVGQESLLLHDIRSKLALSALKLKTWPFPGRIAVQEGADYLVLEPWTLLGIAHSEEQLAELGRAPPRGTFDADVYRILVRHLARTAKIAWHDLRHVS